MQQPEPDASHHNLKVFRQILASSDDTGGQFSLLWCILPPFWAERDVHQHLAHAEGCYVLAGALAVTVGEQTQILHTGQSALAPRCTPHRFWNPTAAPTTVLLVAMPGRTEDALLAQEELKPIPIAAAPP